MNSTKTIRIATVTATGNRYIVQQLSLGKTPEGDRVHCWGEVVSIKGLSTKHSASKTFPRGEVEIAELPSSFSLLEDLWHQNIRELRARGAHVTVSRTGRTAKNWTPGIR